MYACICMYVYAWMCSMLVHNILYVNMTTDMHVCLFICAFVYVCAHMAWLRVSMRVCMCTGRVFTKNWQNNSLQNDSLQKLLLRPSWSTVCSLITSLEDPKRAQRLPFTSSANNLPVTLTNI